MQTVEKLTNYNNSIAQRLILGRMDDLEKNQEKLQKDLRDLIDELKDNQN
jgi:hypothetical protein